MTRSQQKAALFVVLVAALVALLWSNQGQQGHTDGGLKPAPRPTVALSDLPPEARQTVDLIERGGPFPHPGKDGSVFGNREHLLPQQPRGFYREYTVPTPGSRDRGARRIITGGDTMYWTPDHYRSFARIVE